MDENNYCYRYPHPAVTTDCAIFAWDGRELNVLLVQRGIEPFKGRWALPGGFLKMDETAEQGAQRELWEETGLRAEIETCGDGSGFGYISQLGAFSTVNRDPRERVITIAFYALVKMGEVRGGDDADDAKWVPINSLPPLAFDHKTIIDRALDRIREDVHFRPLAFKLLPEVFTMPQLQAIYEQVLGVEFDRRNFAKKMQALGLLKPLQADEGPSIRCCRSLSDDKQKSRRTLLHELVEASAPDISFQLCLDARPSSRVGREPAFYTFDADRYAALKSQGLGRLEF